MKYTCIYCKQEKDESEFNREHVVPRMMGRYTQGLVLSQHQVCQECNSYFSKELENKIGLNSYEAFLRMKSGTKVMRDGRKISGNRLVIEGTEGILKGIKFIPVAVATNPDRFALEISPCVGLKNNDDTYEYFSIDEIPDATEEIIQRLKKFEAPIIHFGYDEEQVGTVLAEKGYINSNFKYSEKSIADELGGADFQTRIKFSIDSILRRICAKTVFNYLCLNSSAADMLDSKFDVLRNYIRYGQWDDSLWFRYSTGYVTTATPPNDTSHVVGTMIRFCDENCELLGCITWFGEMTYIFKICNINPVEEKTIGADLIGAVLPAIDTKFTYFNNETTEITEDESSLFVYGERSD